MATTVDFETNFTDTCLEQWYLAPTSSKILVAILVGAIFACSAWFVLKPSLGSGISAFALAGLSLLLGFSFMKGQHALRGGRRKSLSISEQYCLLSDREAQRTSRYDWERVLSVKRASGSIILFVWQGSYTPILIDIPIRFFKTSAESEAFFGECQTYFNRVSSERERLRRTDNHPAFKYSGAIRVINALLAVTIGGYALYAFSEHGSHIGTIALLIFAPIGMYLNQLSSGAEKYIQQARISRLQKNLPDALITCRNGSKAFPEDSRFYSEAALVLYEQNKVEEAERECEQAIKLNSDVWFVYWLRGFRRFQRKQSQEALQDLDKAIELEPNKEVAYTIRALVRGEGVRRYEDAIDDCTEALRCFQSDFDSLILRGSLLSRVNKHEEALRDAEHAVDICKGNVQANSSGAYRLQAFCHAGLNELGAASEAIEMAIKEQPDDPQNYQVASYVERLKGQPQSALSLLDRTEELRNGEENLESIFTGRAIANLMLGNTNEALSLAARALTAERTEVTLATMAAVFVRQGLFKEALPLLEESVSLDEFYAMGYWFLHEAHAALGNTAESQVAFEKASAFKYKPYF